ncbi:hypothetical protein FB451DRAFT_620914 [Mycena latifolia]|nr:hypothetical protein FB451DRAFT_620914 [Mycena latifolia]
MAAGYKKRLTANLKSHSTVPSTEMRTTPQLNLSLLLGFLSLIPNNSIRYAVLGLVVVVTMICTLNLKRPSTQLHVLETTIEATEDLISVAEVQGMGHRLAFAEERLRLLEIKRSASVIHCRILETHCLTCTKYRRLSKDIAACASAVKCLRIAVELIVQLEHQRKYTQEINDARSILTAVLSRDGNLNGDRVKVFQPSPFEFYEGVHSV